MAVRAQSLSDGMRIAAALAMVELASLADADELVPVPLQTDIHPRIALAVAQAAVAEGLAGAKVDTSLLTLEAFAEAIADTRLLPFMAR